VRLVLLVVEARVRSSSLRAQSGRAGQRHWYRRTGAAVQTQLVLLSGQRVCVLRRGRRRLWRGRRAGADCSRWVCVAGVGGVRCESVSLGIVLSAPNVSFCIPRFWILVIDNDKVVVVFYYPSLRIRLGLFNVDNQAIAWIHALERPCSLLLYAWCISGGYGRGFRFLGSRHEFCDCIVSYGLCGGKVAHDDSVQAFGLF